MAICGPIQGKKLLFMGGEFGQSEEWNYATSLQWHLNEYKDHSGIAALIRDLNQLYRTEPALAETDFIEESFRWIACWDSEAGIISYSRTAPDGHNIVMVVCHFTPVERNNYRIGLPRAGYWKEVLNTNSGFYGGSDLGNGSGIHSESLAFDDLDQSAEFVLPPVRPWSLNGKGSAKPSRFGFLDEATGRLDSSLGLLTRNDLFPNLLYARVENLFEASQLISQRALD